MHVYRKLVQPDVTRPAEFENRLPVVAVHVGEAEVPPIVVVRHPERQCGRPPVRPWRCFVSLPLIDLP